jgi:hypothetical protein
VEVPIRTKTDQSGSSHGQAKLTESTVIEIRALAATDPATNTHAVLAARYGVSRAAIQLLCQGKTWRHVPMPVDVTPVPRPSRTRVAYRPIDPATCTEYADRFWALVAKGPDCWLWTGTTDRQGRATFSMGTSWVAARVSWTLHHGTEPGPLQVCHTCDNPLCVRPDHLFLGTAKANTADRIAKGRGTLKVERPSRVPRQHKPIDLAHVAGYAQRFHEKYTRAGQDECWRWTACAVPSGSGQMTGMVHFARNGGGYPASRIAYAIHHGVDPGAFQVCHTCDNRLCVNPDHLFLGTARDNMRDMIDKGRDRQNPARGEQTNRSKVTADDVREIRRAWSAREATQGELAAKYGIGPGQVHNILTRYSWDHVD